MFAQAEIFSWSGFLNAASFMGAVSRAAGSRVARVRKALLSATNQSKAFPTVWLQAHREASCPSVPWSWLSVEKAIRGLFPLGQHPKIPRVFGVARRRFLRWQTLSQAS
jgi:hypothetical protein